MASRESNTQLYQHTLSFEILNKVSHDVIIIIAFSTIVFGLRGQSGGFCEEVDTKEARGLLIKEGGKG
jgi:hypothetical protein